MERSTDVLRRSAEHALIQSKYRILARIVPCKHTKIGWAAGPGYKYELPQIILAGLYAKQRGKYRVFVSDTDRVHHSPLRGVKQSWKAASYQNQTIVVDKRS